MKKSSLFLLLLLLLRSHSKKAPGNTSYLGSERWRARRTREKLEREMTRSLSLSQHLLLLLLGARITLF